VYVQAFGDAFKFAQMAAHFSIYNSSKKISNIWLSEERMYVLANMFLLATVMFRQFGVVTLQSETEIVWLRKIYSTAIFGLWTSFFGMMG